MIVVQIESPTISEPAKRAIAVTIEVNRHEPAVAHSAGLNTFSDTFLGFRFAALHPRLYADTGSAGSDRMVRVFAARIAESKASPAIN